MINLMYKHLLRHQSIRTYYMHMHILAGKGVAAARRDVLGVSAITAPCEEETPLSSTLSKKAESITED